MKRITTDSRQSSEFARIEAALSGAYEGHEYPLSLVGDLDDLNATLQRAQIQVEEILASVPESNGLEIRKKFYMLEILLAEDLPLIFRDIVPELRKLRRNSRMD